MSSNQNPQQTYADRIAMCQAEAGPHEHVPLKPGEDPGSCFMDCDCGLRVYVALDAVVEALRARDRPLAPTTTREVADFIEREFGAHNHA